MDLFLFKCITIVILTLFTFFVSDFRSKKGMAILLKKYVIILIKIFYFSPIFIYIYLILKIENIYFISYLGLIANFIGTILVIKAKLDLGKYHAWAGYVLSSTKIIKNGIYAFIRHPLYTGIHVFIFGGIIVGINNNPFSSVMIILILSFIFLIMFFLNISALRENKYLHEMFGKDYLEYKNQVHAFLPIRKYGFNENN